MPGQERIVEVRLRESDYNYRECLSDVLVQRGFQRDVPFTWYRDPATGELVALQVQSIAQALNMAGETYVV